MTLVTLRPNAAGAGEGPSLSLARQRITELSDDSDSSYVTSFDMLSDLSVHLSDLTLPAGAVIKHVKDRARIARVGGGASEGVDIGLRDGALGGVYYQERFVLVNWGTPTTISGPETTGLTDAQIDNLRFTTSGGGTSFGENVRLYEAYVDVTYVTKPVVAVTGPTGTITTTNLPTVEWSNTLDADGGAQTFYRVKIFTDEQYLTTGFDPATSPHLLDSGELAGAGSSWQASQTLPDDTYRAYVRAAQTVNGAVHWSAWGAFSQFVIDVELPAVPTLTAVPDGARIKVVMA